MLLGGCDSCYVSAHRKERHRKTQKSLAVTRNVAVAVGTEHCTLFEFVKKNAFLFSFGVGVFERAARVAQERRTVQTVVGVRNWLKHTCFLCRRVSLATVIVVIRVERNNVNTRWG